MCKKCYKKAHCSERDEYGRCTEYRRIDEMRKEIADLNQSEKPSSGTDRVTDQAPGCREDVDGDQACSKRLLLGQI